MENIFLYLGIASLVLVVVILVKLLKHGVFPGVSLGGLPAMPAVNSQLVWAVLAAIAVLWIRIEGWILPSFLEKSWVITILLAALVFWVVYKSMYTWIGWLIGAIIVLNIIGGIRSCGSSKPGTGGNSGATRGLVSDPLSSGSGTLTPGEVQKIWAVPGETFFRSDTPVKLKYSLASNPLVFWIEDPTDQKPWPNSKRTTGYWEVKNLSETTTILIEWGKR